MSEPVPVTMLSAEYHIAIGVITVNAALMDQLIDHAIWVLLTLPPERGVTITKLVLSTSRKIGFMRDLLTPMTDDKAVKRDFHNVFSKLKSAQKNRSKIVHAKWVVKRSDQSVHIEVPESFETEPEIEPMPLERLQHYGTEIAKAHKALEEFFLKVQLTQDSVGQHVWPPRAASREYPKKK